MVGHVGSRHGHLGGGGGDVVEGGLGIEVVLGHAGAVPGQQTGRCLGVEVDSGDPGPDRPGESAGPQQGAYDSPPPTTATRRRGVDHSELALIDVEGNSSRFWQFSMLSADKSQLPFDVARVRCRPLNGQQGIPEMT